MEDEGPGRAPGLNNLAGGDVPPAFPPASFFCPCLVRMQAPLIWKGMVLASRPTRALLVINALSRSGAAMGEAAHRLLADQGCTVTRLDSRTSEEVSPWIAQQGDAADFVMVAGGDGTMNAAARGLLATGLPLALLPAGTANDLARTLGLGGCTLEQCVSLPTIGRTSKIDLGEANGHLFFNVASIGLSADLAQALTREAKRRFGRWSYIIAALRALRAVRPFRATVSHDGQTVRVRTLQIAIGNGRYYGGGNLSRLAVSMPFSAVLVLCRLRVSPDMLDRWMERHGRWLLVPSPLPPAIRDKHSRNCELSRFGLYPNPFRRRKWRGTRLKAAARRRNFRRAWTCPASPRPIDAA